MNDSRDLRWRLSCYDSGQWFQFPVVFLQFLREAEAIFLASVINIVCMKLRNGHEEDGWIRLTNADCRKVLPYTDRKIERLLISLKEKRILESRRQKKVGGRRWVTVNVDMLDMWSRDPTKLSELDPLKLSELDPLKLSEPLLLRKRNKKDTKKEHCRDCVSTDWISFASLLKDGIQQVRQINFTSRVKGWAPHFRLLHEKDEVAPVRMLHVLKWYCKALKKHGDPNVRNGNASYLPVCLSGGSFREKFLSIENAKSRLNPHTRPKKKIKIVESTRSVEELKNDPDFHAGDLFD